jgi:hypothetical protein
MVDVNITDILIQRHMEGQVFVLLGYVMREGVGCHHADVEIWVPPTMCMFFLMAYQYANGCKPTCITDNGPSVASQET